MQYNDFIYILFAIIVVLVIIVIILAMRLYALKRFIKSRYHFPLHVIKEAVSKKYRTLISVYKFLYIICDNFPKHSEKLCKVTSRAYHSGVASNLCSDMIYVTDMCEGGSINKLALQYKLSEQETKTCCFIYWGFKRQEICLVEKLTENAYDVRCSRIRKKFNLAKEETIPAFLDKFCRENTICCS